MSIMSCSVLAGGEVSAEWVMGPGRGGRDSHEVSEGLLVRHTCKELHTGQAVEGMQSPAEDSWRGCQSSCASIWRRLMFGQRSVRL